MFTWGFMGFALAVVALWQNSGLRGELRKLSARLSSLEVVPLATNATAPRVTTEPVNEPVVEDELEEPVSVKTSADEIGAAEAWHDEPALVPTEIAPASEEMAAESLMAADEPITQSAAMDQPATSRIRSNPLQGLEEHLAARWFVWVGAAAVALGGLLLVRYIAQHTVLPPAVRLTLSFVAGLALIAGGAYLRRTKTAAGTYIPAGLTSGGLVTAFGSIYAAHAIYGLLGPTVAFVGLGAVALAALALALMQGPLVGAVGLVGSYLTPALVVSHDPQALGLFLYLLIILAASFAVLRYRKWDWLGYLAVLGTAGWGVFWVESEVYTPSDALVVGLFVYAFAVISTFGLLGLKVLTAEQGSLLNVATMTTGLRLALLGAVLGIGILSIQVRESHYAFLALLFFAGALAEISIFGLVRQGNSLATPLAAAVGWLVLISDIKYGRAWFSPMHDTVFGVWATLALVFFVGIGAVGFLRKENQRIWAGVAGGSAVAYLLGGYFHSPLLLTETAWGSVFLAFAAGLLFVARWKQNDEIATAILLAAAALLAVFGLSRLAEGLWFALLVAGLAIGYAFASRIFVTAYVGRIATILAAIAEFRLFLLHIGNSSNDWPWGEHWPVYGYGLPAIGFWVASRILREEKYARSRIAFEGLSLGLLITLMSLELHAFISGGAEHQSMSLLEIGAHISSWLGAAYGLAYRQSLFSSRTSKWGAIALLGLSGITYLLGCLGLFNPLIDHASLEGGAVLNSLLLAYLVPSILVLGISRKVAGLELGKYQSWFEGAALFSFATYLFFETRHLFEVFQGPSELGLAELGVYFCAWLVLVYGLASRQTLLTAQTVKWGGRALLALSALAFVTAIILALDDESSSRSLIDGVVLNGLILSFLIPAVLTLAISRKLMKFELSKFQFWFEAASLFAFVAYLTLEERHLFYFAHGYAGMGLLEMGVYVCTWLLVAHGLVYRQTIFSTELMKWGGRSLILLSAVVLVFGGLHRFNPMIFRQAVEGNVVLNSLLVAYLAPSLLLALFTRRLDVLDWKKLYIAFGSASLGGLLVYLTIELKRVFEGPVLEYGFASDAESYALSVTWLAFALALLVSGLRMGKASLRYGGVGILALTLFKTFGYDLWQLGGLWQVASITGFGLSLVGIGWLYARIARKAEV